MLKKNDLLKVAAILALGAIFWAILGPSTPGRPHYQHSDLLVTRADGKAFKFAVEVALTPQEEAYGLMFVRKLAEDAGMIFPSSEPHIVSFWMKNTLIPLDMLFVRPDGTICRIVSEARPEDLTPISSMEPVIAVVEIKGGQAKKDGFAVGDKIESPALHLPIGKPSTP